MIFSFRKCAIKTSCLLHSRFIFIASVRYYGQDGETLQFQRNLDLSVIFANSYNRCLLLALARIEWVKNVLCFLFCKGFGNLVRYDLNKSVKHDSFRNRMFRFMEKRSVHEHQPTDELFNLRHFAWCVQCLAIDNGIAHHILLFAVFPESSFDQYISVLT